MQSVFLDAALYYASLGWCVFPLAPGQKTPITAHGCKDATTDLDQIKHWWSMWPNANIGLACGERSGLYAVDIDVKPDANGFESLREFPELPHTIRQDTPNHGAHLLYRSTVPPANKNHFRPGIDIRGDGYYIVLPPSLHPNGGEYKWTLGQEPWVATPSEYPEFLRPSTRNVASCVNTPANVPICMDIVTSPDVLKRAGQYLSQCDPAIQGYGGHGRLLWAAVTMVHGFCLSDSEAYVLLASIYNPTCVPPWNLSNKKDEKDFRRKISEARKVVPQYPRGWLLNDSAYSNQECTCEVDISSILNARNIPQPINSFDAEKEYQFLIAPTGLLGELCSWIESTSFRTQPLLTLACSITFLGALFGRKVKDESGSRTNLYCMGVAPSSAGKNHAPNRIRELSYQAGCVEILGGDYVASDAAVEERMSHSAVTLFLWDEIGHFLSHIKSGISQCHAQVISLLMKIYSSAGSIYLGREYAEKEKQRMIVQPCCCVYGTSTIERFTSGISPMELQDGWLSRCLVFNAPNMVPKNRTKKNYAIPASLVATVRKWSERKNELDSTDGHSLSPYTQGNGLPPPPTQITVPTDADAERIFIDFDNEAIEYGSAHPTLACLWAKGEENARRIALIIACSDSYENPTINVSSADYACRLVRYLLLDFSSTIAPEIVFGEIDARKRKVIRVIEKAGVAGMMKRDLSRATPELSKDVRDKIIIDLIESGEIADEYLDRPTVTSAKSHRYWTAEHYATKLMSK